MTSIPISELGEDAVLALVLDEFRRAGVLADGLAGPGDDCALLPAQPFGTVMSTDMMVEDVDFHRTTFTPFDIGWKIAAVNLSDIGAMGSRPNALTLSAGLPETMADTEVAELARGVAKALDTLAPGTRVVGGDLSSSPTLVLAATVTGAALQHPVRRSGAQVGDQLAIAGQLGWAYCGWQLLDTYAPSQLDVDVSVIHRALAAQRQPRPPVHLGVEAALAQATAMIDVSDGLLQDATRIARSSQIELDLSASVLDGFVYELLSLSNIISVDLRSAVLRGGEDFALLATFPPDVRLPDGFVAIGSVIDTSVPGGISIDGRPVEDAAGWSHFEPNMQ